MFLVFAESANKQLLLVLLVPVLSLSCVWLLYLLMYATSALFSCCCVVNGNILYFWTWCQCGNDQEGMLHVKACPSLFSFLSWRICWRVQQWLIMCVTLLCDLAKLKLPGWLSPSNTFSHCILLQCWLKMSACGFPRHAFAWNYALILALLIGLFSHGTSCTVLHTAC